MGHIYYNIFNVEFLNLENMPNNAINPHRRTNYGGTTNNGYEQKQCCRYGFQ